MGAPILLGGAVFGINRSFPIDMQRSGVWMRKPDPEAYAVLAEMVALLGEHGHKITKPHRGKPDDVRCRCLLKDRYIEVILSVEPRAGSPLSFGLDAWGDTKVHSGAARRELEETWQRQATVINEVIRSRFAAESVAWLSPKEVNERYIAKRHP